VARQRDRPHPLDYSVAARAGLDPVIASKAKRSSRQL